MIRRRARRTQEQAELNITAFLNLMVILIPFLLITAVFSRITILELNIPPASDNPQTPQQEQPKEKPLEINIIVRSDTIVVADNRGFAKPFQKEPDKDFDLKAVSKLLQDMKDRIPDHTSANILLDMDVPYDVLISLMDTVRLVSYLDDEGLPAQMELFPDIAIGDAPPPQNKTTN